MTHILLVRHGETDWVQKNRLAGWLPDIHLNETGQQQADAVADRLASLPLKSIYSSPITRCLETAAAIARRHQLAVCDLPGVIEVRYGQWEGQKIKKLAKDPRWFAVQHYPSRFRFPDGESLAEVQARAVIALEEVAQRHPKEMIVVTSHADVIKLAVAHYLGIHMDLFQRIVIAPASVTILSLSSQGGVRVARVNDDGPIQAPEPETTGPQKGRQKKNKAEPKQIAGNDAEAVKPVSQGEDL
jgi:probable phosphomutase (TIGR03848 family)